MTSLPVPFSPLTSTIVSVVATQKGAVDTFEVNFLLSPDYLVFP